MAKNIFTTIQYVIDSILNHNKEATAHSDIRTAIEDGDEALNQQLTVLQGSMCIKKVITTKEELDNKNLESGIYSVEGVLDEQMNSLYYMLIVNRHMLNPDFGTQLAIPYDGGASKGMFQRNSTPSGWSAWLPYAYSSTYIPTPTLGVSVAHGETPRIVKVGKLCTLYGSINITAISNTYHIFDYIPPEYKPIIPAEIKVSAVVSPELPYHARLYVNTDGSISIHGINSATTSDVTFNGSWEVL